MPDISKCSNKDCIKKEECYRWFSIPDEYAQSYAAFYPEDNTIENFKCEYIMIRDVNGK